MDRPADIAGTVAVRRGCGCAALSRHLPGRPCSEHVSAGALASLAAEKLAAGEELEAPRPLYLRRPDAQVPKNYKVVTPK